MRDETERRLLRAALERQDESLASLSRRLGRNPAYLQQYLQRGTPRRLPQEILRRLAELLSLAPGALGIEEARPAPAVPAPPGSRPLPEALAAPGLMPRDLPVMGSTRGGTEGDFTLNGQVVDYVRRPPGLAHTSDAFALYVEGESMWPWREAGSLVVVHPARPPRIGDHVVVELTAPLPEDLDGGELDGEERGAPRPADRACYVKRLLARDAKGLRLGQYNPPRDDIAVPLSQVSALYRVMEWEELHLL